MRKFFQLLQYKLTFFIKNEIYTLSSSFDILYAYKN